AVGHKGGRTVRCRVHGRAAHAALAPKAVNAIEYAARLIVGMRERADRFIARKPRHDGYDVPHSTLMTGVINEGTAGNIVPRDREFRFGMRHLPATDPEVLLAEIRDFAARELVPEMRRLAPEADITFEQTGEVPHFEIDPRAALVHHVAGRLGDSSAAHVVF